MSDRPTLADRLTRLASAGFGQGTERTLRASSKSGLLRAILSEADTIVMPRELRLRGGAGKGLALEVANRRILRVRPLSAGAEATTLDPSDETVADTLRGMVADALGAASSARVAHWPLERDIDPAEPGFSVRTLSEAWSVPLEAPRDGDGDTLDRFLSAAGSALPAWLMISGEVSESFGDEDLVASLVTLSEGDLSGSLQERHGAEAWLFAAIGKGGTDGHHRAVAVLGETLFLMAIAPGKLGEVADLWREALA